MEHFDGAEVHWDGKSELRDKNRDVVNAPSTFTSQLPSFPIGGVLWYVFPL